MLFRSEDLPLREEDRHFGQSLGYRAENIFLSFFFYKFIYLFNFWLRWVFVAACGLSLVAASGATLRCGAQASHYGGFSCCRVQALSAWASAVVARGLSCSVACEIFPDQGFVYVRERERERDRERETERERERQIGRAHV